MKTLVIVAAGWLACGLAVVDEALQGAGGANALGGHTNAEQACKAFQDGRFVFQGASDTEYRGNPYGKIPWRLGILEMAR